MNTLQKKKRSYDTVTVNVEGLRQMVAPAVAKQGVYRVVNRDDVTSVRTYGSQGLKAGLPRANMVERPDSSSAGHVFLQGSFLLSTVLLGHGMEIMKMSDADESTRPIGQSFDAPLLLAACENETLQTMASFERPETVDAPPEFNWSRDKYRARVAAAEFGKSINADY